MSEEQYNKAVIEITEEIERLERKKKKANNDDDNRQLEKTHSSDIRNANERAIKQAKANNTQVKRVTPSPVISVNDLLTNKVAVKKQQSTYYEK